MKSLEVFANGLTHHVLDWGAPRGGASVALLLHGFMDAAGTWDFVAPHLRDAGFHVVAPDLRGFGKAPRAPQGGYYHFADYVMDVMQIVRVLEERTREVAPLYIVGHSMGGTVATLLTGATVLSVRALAVLEGLGPEDNAFSHAPQRMQRWLTDVPKVLAMGQHAPLARQEALRRLSLAHPGVRPDVLETRLVHLAETLPDGTVRWRYDPLHKTTSPTTFFADALKAFAARIPCPALFVSGGPDGYHPKDEALRIAAFPNCRVETLSGAGHMMHWTRPSDLAAHLIAFFLQ